MQTYHLTIQKDSQYNIRFLIFNIILSDGIDDTQGINGSIFVSSLPSGVLDGFLEADFFLNIDFGTLE